MACYYCVQFLWRVCVGSTVSIACYYWVFLLDLVSIACYYGVCEVISTTCYYGVCVLQFLWRVSMGLFNNFYCVLFLGDPVGLTQQFLSRVIMVSVKQFVSRIIMGSVGNNLSRIIIGSIEQLQSCVLMGSV